MPEERLIKEVYQSSVSGESGRGKTSMTWDGKVEGYIKERVTVIRGIEVAKESCLDRELWRPFCHGHPLLGSSLVEQGLASILYCTRYFVYHFSVTLAKALAN